MGRAAGGQPGSSVASRIFAVLDAFNGSEDSLRLTMIAERARLPLPTALRMVRELVAWGGLERQHDGSYRVGLKIWALGATSPHLRRIREIGVPYLQGLFAATRQNIQLTVRDETAALVLDRINGLDTWEIYTRMGGHLPLYATGVGKVLLADAPAAVIEEVVSRGLRRLTPYTIDTPGRLLRELEKVRDAQIAYVYEEFQLGSASIAVPVVDESGRTVAAIGIVSPTHVQQDKFVPILRKAAQTYSRELIKKHVRDL
jgi:DNA-binding IclR family transcriptional regulator